MSTLPPRERLEIPAWESLEGKLNLRNGPTRDSTVSTESRVHIQAGAEHPIRWISWPFPRVETMVGRRLGAGCVMYLLSPITTNFPRRVCARHCCSYLTLLTILRPRMPWTHHHQEGPYTASQRNIGQQHSAPHQAIIGYLRSSIANLC